jgi:hypothetical protein
MVLGEVSGHLMVLRGVSVHWIVHGSGRCISAPDRTWFWKEYECTHG